MRRSSKKRRSDAKLYNPLHRDLAAYALAASAAGVSALVLSAPADAQVVYTPAHVTIGRHGKLLIDFNHDGMTDVVIREIPWDSAGLPGRSLQAVPRHVGGGIKVGNYSNFAANMAPGSEIGPADVFFSRPAVMFQAALSLQYYFGSWAPYATNQYLGVRFAINGETHYGWARLNTAYDYQSQDVEALLTGYAYQTQPNEPIRAGDTGDTGADSEPVSQMTIPAAPRRNEPSTLGTLALGSGGLKVWRRDQ
jgi:hypothetical protein